LFLLAGLKTANAASVFIWINMELAATALLGTLIFKDTLDKYAWMGVVFTIVAGIITSFGDGSYCYKYFVP
jgi:drug/metabolite transporter (DMT)-like permease